MDKARIDWLEERKGLLNYADNGPHVCIDDGRDHNYHVYGGTYREAGKIEKAEKLYAKSQYWHDKMNEALGN